MAVQINVAANQAALTASIQAGVQAYNQRFAQNNPINLSVNQRAFSQPLGRMTGDVKDFEAALAASNARVIAFGASTAVLGGVIRSFKELANVTIDVEKNLADINRVFGLTTSQLQKFSTDLFSVGKQTASSFDDASKAALEFSRQGLKAEEVLIRTKDALTLARVAGISTANSVDALTSTVNGFAATGVTTSQILNKLVAVEQDFAVGAGDLAEALSRTGQAAQEAGVSLDQLNALVTAAQQSTARGGAVIGNALKTIFTRLQRTETLDQLEAFNIAVRDVQGNTLPAVTVLQNFAGAYKNLGDAQRAQLSEQVAGVYQVNILKAIVGDLNKSQGVYAGALQRGASATNEAEIATAKLNQTLDALLKQTATSTQQLANNIGKVTFEPLARYGTEQLKSLVESMNEILEGEGVGSTFANGLLKGIRNVIAGPGAIAAFFTLFKLIQNSFTYLAQALPQIAGITTETQNRKNIEQSILQIMQQQGPVSQALAGAMGNQAAQAQLLLQLARQQTAEYQIQSTLAKQLATQLAGQGVRVKGSGGLQVTRAGGYIPNATRIAEAVGAQAGGYAPGKVVKSPVGGVMNTAEDVKYVPGFAQPFINPPAGSKAGRAHRQNAISRTGVDPYMNDGFIPNFAEEQQKLVTEKLNVKDGDTIAAYPVVPLSKDFRLASVDAPEGGQFGYEEAKKLLAYRYSKTSGIDLLNSNILANRAAYNRGVFDDPAIAKLLVKRGLAVPDLRYTRDSELIGLANTSWKNKTGIWQYPDHPKVDQFKSQQDTIRTTKLGEKDYKQKPKIGETVLKNQTDFNRLTINSKRKFEPKSAEGFIPNFAPPTSAMRIPWFKKFANPAYDNIQPTLGISRASDVDTFGSNQFRSKAFEKAATDGDPNIFGPLYEDFGRKALQLTNKSNIFGEFVRGSVLQPKAERSQTAFDDALLQETGIIGFDFKGFRKKNLSGGSVAKHMTDKYNRVAKTNPEQAAKIKEAIMVFNEPGHENQLPSEFSKNFLSLAGTSYSQMLKNSPDLVKGLSAETNSLLNNYVKNPAFLAMNVAKGFVPNFAGKDIATKFFKTQTGPDLFSSKGTGLSGTVYRQPGYRSSGYQLKEQLNNMVMSILGNNVFFPDASSLNPKIYGDVNKGAENSAKTAALKLSSGGKTSSLGLGAGMMSETFGNSRYVPDREAVYTGEVSGKMKRVNYDRLSDILGAFWSANPETKSAWESLKNTSETGKFEEKQNIRVKTSLLKKAYEDFLVKNNYIGTRVKLNSYRKRAEGVEGVNYGSLRSDLAGTSNVRNIDKHGGFIPNFAYKQAVMGLEESMSGNKAVFDTKPFPHIRNKSQPTFSSAIADHGGLGNALSDSMRGQKDAGLMSGGFMPNFATLDVRQSTGSEFANLSLQQRTQFLELNRALSQLARNTNLTTQQQDALRQTIRTNARSLEVSTGSNRIVNDANRALGVSLQQNANAQRTAAAQQQRQNTQNTQSPQQNTQQNTPSLAQRFLGASGERADKFASSKLGGIVGILGGSMIGGQLESLIQGNKQRFEMSEGRRFAASAGSSVLTAATTGAEIGSVIPVLGSAAGAAIGALIGFSKAAYDSQTTLEDLTAAAENYKTKTSQTISTAEAYINKLESLSKIEDPFEKIKASDELQNLFEKLKQEDLSDIFKSTGGSVAEMQKAIIEFTKKTNQVKSIQEFSKTVKGIDDKTKTPFFDIKSFQEKIQKNYGYTMTGGLGQSTGSQNMYIDSGGAITKTEENLQRSFQQYQGFFNVLSTFNLDEKQAQAFVQEFAKETNSFFNVNPDAIKEIAQKYGISEEAAKELGKFGEEVLGKSGVVGTFFSKNLPEITERFINKSNVDFKTNIQKAEIKGVLVAPLIKTIKDSIENYVFNTASQLQNMEFDSNRLKVLENAANEYLDSISSPLEKASREAVSKTREAVTKTEESGMRFTSGFEEKIGSKLPSQLGGSNVEIIERIGKLVENFKTSSQEDQLKQINKLIGDTDSLEATRNAGYENIKPEEVKSLNAELIKERDSLKLLMQAKKESISLTTLENDVAKRKAESTERLLILQNQLIESDTKRAISIASQKANIDIRENDLQNTRKIPGFGFGMSEGQVTRSTIDENRRLMQDRQGVTRKNLLGNTRSQLKNNFIPILDSIEKAYEKIQQAAISEQPDLYKKFNIDKIDISKIYDLKNLIDQINDKSSLEQLKTSLQDTLKTVNSEATPTLFKSINDEIKNISETLIELNKESKIFESNASADIKIADVNDRINNAYIYRLNTILQIEKAQRKVLNTIEIQEQILDTERSRPSNFFGLGVTGKAEKQIQFDERSLALKQSRQNAQATQNVQQQLSQFETYRSKIKAEGLGPNSFGFAASQEKINKAKTAIANLDTSKITNVDQAKDFVQQLSKVRIENGLQGEAAKTLADTEKEINSILNSNVDELDKMRSIQDILNGKVRQEAKDRQSIKMGFKEGFDQIQEDADTGLNKLAKDTPILFRDGMVDAIKATIRETDNLDAALMGIASKFLDTFSTQLMNTGISKIISGSGLGSVFGAQTGGLIRAQSGMYISGTGTGDKYPAMLENGEYVLNRRAVMAMGGPSALDSLNFSAAPRFASGGSFGFDLASSKSDQDNLVNMEKYMTSEGLDNSQLYNELSDVAKQKAQEDRAKKLADKQQKAAMIGSLVAAAATVAIGAGISNVAQNAQATKAKAFSSQMAETRGSNPLMMSGKEFTQLQKFQSKNLISPSGFSYIGGTPQTGFKSLLSSPVRGQAWYEKAGSAISKPFGRKQTGGLIGSRLSDIIPGYMEGGLYDSPMVKRYGIGLQSGGSPISSTGNSNSTVNNNTNASNSFNFNTSVQRDGSIKMGANTTSYQQQDVELSKNLNTRMYAVVTEVIRKEKQFGGSLAGIRN